MCDARPSHHRAVSFHPLFYISLALSERQYQRQLEMKKKIRRREHERRSSGRMCVLRALLGSWILNDLMKPRRDKNDGADRADIGRKEQLRAPALLLLW